MRKIRATTVLLSVLLPIGSGLAIGWLEAPGLAQSAPAFEVVSIRKHVNPPRPAVVTAGSVPDGFRKITLDSANAITGNQVHLQIVNLRDLIADAYGVKDFQILRGGPGAAQDESYDVTAKTTGDAAPTKDQVRLMLQAMLADRFQLKLRRDEAELAVYNLEVAKSGLKMRPVPATDPGSPPTGMRRQSVEELVVLMNRRADRPILNKTGLSGAYEYSSDFIRAIGEGLDSSAIFTAVQEHLGLKLDAVKSPVLTLVVEKADKPTEN